MTVGRLTAKYCGLGFLNKKVLKPRRETPGKQETKPRVTQNRSQGPSLIKELK